MFYSLFTNSKNIYNLETNQILIESDFSVLSDLIGEELSFKPNFSIKGLYLIGPVLNFETPWSTNFINICYNCGINWLIRIEKFRYSNKDIYDKMIEKSYTKNITDFNYEGDITEVYNVPLDKIKKFNEDNKTGFDDTDIKFCEIIFKDKRPTNVELYDLSQSNSEHSRHWFFKGGYKIVDNNKIIYDDVSLFDKVKDTLTYKTNNNSIVSFCDNASSIKGTEVKHLINKDSEIILSKQLLNIVFTAETHNFPTGIAPFPGSSTGVGGRIRDSISIGKGAGTIAGTAGYCVGNLNISDYIISGEQEYIFKKPCEPMEILLKASDGASDYGNKFGEPIINGFTRSFGLTIDNKRNEWIKPIMFSGGLGYMYDENNFKDRPCQGDLIVRIGGPAYKIGIGGGSASSRCHSSENSVIDYSAVQRGDPCMENKVARIVRNLSSFNNPILSIHDQGAGGTGNVTKEIVEDVGGEIDIRKIVIGDKSMSVLELWTAEFQEQVTFLIKPKDRLRIENMCKRENVPLSIPGMVKDTGVFKVYDSLKDNYPVNLPLDPISKLGLRKEYTLTKNKLPSLSYNIPNNLNLIDHIKNVFKLVSVGSKRFLTNKVDRSVTGLIVQQQCVGPFHTPLSNYALIAHDYYGLTGSITALGEQPIKSLLNPEAMARLTIAEMLMNIVWCVNDLDNIRCSGNWMWPNDNSDDKYNLYIACKSMCDFSKDLGIAFDGGKDSLSMYCKEKDEIVKSPPSLVVSGYNFVNDYTKRVQCCLQKTNSVLLYVNLGVNRMGGSSLLNTFNTIGNDCPDVNSKDLLNLYNLIQKLIIDGKILSGHDRSDGGLITTICEMSHSSDIGVKLEFNNMGPMIDVLFNEEIGCVIEVCEDDVEYIINMFNEKKLDIYNIGKTVDHDIILINWEGNNVLCESITNIRKYWNETSFRLEEYQCNCECVESEREIYYYKNHPKYNLYNNNFNLNFDTIIRKFNVGVIRDHGSNGDREMSMAFYHAGFNVYDFNMADLQNKNVLSKMNGIVFVGGFSHSDVLGAANGWYQTIKRNREIYKNIDEFYKREDTFSMGICNGCQLMSKLDVMPIKHKYIENVSTRFESRFLNVKINSGNSIFFKNMDECVLGIWCAHREGRFITNENINNIGHITYVDNNGLTSDKYPYNPNGSTYNIGGICSENGRHIEMMPHPERCFMNYQWPYLTDDINIQNKNKMGFSPWMKIFRNAYEWCEQLDSIY